MADASAGSSIWSNIGSTTNITPVMQAAGYGIGASQVANANANAASGVETAGTNSATLLNPYAKQGTAAENQLADLYGLNGAAAETGAQSTFANTPGYQFTQAAGNQAIQRQASATGGEFSSATLGALDQYNTGLAQNTYQNYVNNLFGLVQPGASAAAASGSQGIEAATQAGKFGVAQGQASASGVQGAFNSLAPAVTSLFGGAPSGAGGSGGPTSVPSMGVPGMAGGAYGDNPYIGGNGLTYDPSTGMYTSNNQNYNYNPGTGMYTGNGGNNNGLSGNIDPNNGVFIADPTQAWASGGPASGSTVFDGDYASYY